MIYNIYFDISGIIITIIVLLVHSFFYRLKTRANRFYTYFAWWCISAAIMDVVTAFTISYAKNIPEWQNYLLNGMYNVCATMVAFSGVRYIFSCINWQSKISNIINGIICISYGIMVLINPFTGLLYYFENGNYIHGPLFAWNYIVCIILIVHSAVIMGIYRKRFRKRVLVLNSLFIVINFIGSLIQFFFPWLLLTFFTTAVSLFVMLFSLETTDYQTMEKALSDLEKSQVAEEKAKQEAIKANKAKTNFLTKMSHEIRTPINTIMGLNDMILRESVDQQIVEYATKIKNANKSLLEAINDILDLAKIESGKMDLVIEEYELGDLIDSVTNMIKMRAEKKGLKFILKVDEKLPSILFGDEARIKQILVNLLTNAVKYTQIGQIELLINGNLKKDHVILHVEVRDTGVGIKKENMDKLFGVFERIEDSKNKGIEGSGLGISIVQQLLGLMGSELKVKSTYGEGSTFSFDLKQNFKKSEPIGNIEDHISKKAKEYTYQASFIAPEAHILIVDDTDINLYVVQKLLKETEIQIDTALSGPECLEKVKQNHYDLIFLDHMMPGMDGIETLHHIKEEDNLCQNAPIVALTANAVAGIEERYAKEGFSGYISKPIDQQKIENVLSSLLPKVFIKEAPIRKRRQMNVKIDIPEIEGMDSAYAMSHFYSSDVFLDVLQNFYITLNQNADYISQLCSDLDKEMVELSSTIKSYQIAVHTMKSSSALVGMAQISGLAKVAETAAMSEDISKIKVLTPFLVEEMKKIEKRLHVLFETEETKPAIDNNMLRAYLSQLEKALHKIDIDKMDEIIKELDKYSFAENIKDLFSSLKIDVSNLDETNGIKHIYEIKKCIVDESENKTEASS